MQRWNVNRDAVKTLKREQEKFYQKIVSNDGMAIKHAGMLRIRHGARRTYFKCRQMRNEFVEELKNLNKIQKSIKYSYTHIYIFYLDKYVLSMYVFMWYLK